MQREATEESTEQTLCQCPFCDGAEEMPFPFCQPCGAGVATCPSCGEPLPKDKDDCPHCAEQV